MRRFFTKKRLIIIAIFVLLSIAFITSKFFYQLMLIQGDSMLPTYHNLSMVIVDKTDRDFCADDVIAFKCDNVKGVLVKRIVAVSGDTVCIKDNKLYVNDRISEITSADRIKYAGTAEKNILLGDGEYFVLGDNYDESVDSRYEEVGIVQEDNIIGKIIK